MLPNATPLRKSAPGLPNSSDEHVSCTAPATENASLQILFKGPTPAIVFGHATKPSRFAHFWQRAQSLAPAMQNDTWTSKSAPNPLSFLHFWLRNVLRACTFPTSQLPKVVRTWGVFSFFTCTCASRRNGVQFFINHLARWLRTCRFSQPTFRPSGATNHGKNTVLRDFSYLFALGSSFCWEFLFFDLLYYSLLFSDSSHLCFSSVHIVGSLTSKLPSITVYICIYIYVSIYLNLSLSISPYLSSLSSLSSLHRSISISLSLHLSISLSLYPTISFYVSLSLSLCVSVSNSMFSIFSVSRCISLYLYVYPCTSMYISLSLSLSVPPSLRPSVLPFIRPSIGPSVHPSVRLFVHTFICLCLRACTQSCR